MSTTSTFGSRLKQLRQKNDNMTQKALANRLEVSVGIISNYESGKAQPSVDVLLKLASVFSVTTDYLLGHTLGEFSHSTTLAEEEVSEVMESVNNRCRNRLNIICINEDRVEIILFGKPYDLQINYTSASDLMAQLLNLSIENTLSEAKDKISELLH